VTQYNNENKSERYGELPLHDLMAIAREVGTVIILCQPTLTIEDWRQLFKYEAAVMCVDGYALKYKYSSIYGDLYHRCDITQEPMPPELD